MSEPAISPRTRALLLAALVVGAAARFLFTWHPTDYRSLVPWRESDYTQISRAFYREDPNILYPRVDWRGDTSGVVETEFPFLPWIASAAYRVFGYHEQILRLLSAVCGVASLAVFWRLSRRLLPTAGATAGTAESSAQAPGHDVREDGERKKGGEDPDRRRSCRG